MIQRPLHFTLASLLGDFGTDRFLREIYGQRPLHVQAGDADRFDSLMNWGELERLLNITGYWDESRLRLMVDGRRVAPERYCFARSGADGEPRAWRPQPERVMQAIGHGAALVLNGLDGLSPAISAIAQALEAQLAVRVQSNLYLSQRSHRGLPLHYDIHDVLALQIAGRKQWRLHANRAHPAVKPAPERELRIAAGQVAQQITLGPGDFFYLPAGVIHEAFAETDHAMHLTLAIKQVTPIDLASLMMKRLAIRDDLTRPSYDLHEGIDALARHVARLAEGFSEIARNPAELSSLFSEIEANRQPRGRYALDPMQQRSERHQPDK